MAHDFVSSFCHNHQTFSRWEHIILPYHEKKLPCVFLLLHSPWTNSSLLYQCSSYMNESTTTQLQNTVNNWSHVLKLVPAYLMTFCFRIHTSEMLSWFDSQPSLLSLAYELSISTYPHSPGHLKIAMIYASWCAPSLFLGFNSAQQYFFAFFSSQNHSGDPHSYFSAYVSTFIFRRIFYLFCVNEVFSLLRN